MMHDSSSLAQLRAGFASPPRDYSPAPIWWWSGDKLDLERLKWQLDRFADGGVYNVVLLNLAPTGPLYGAEADDPEFFSEAWWTIFRGVCEHARRIGTRIWVYDQIGFSGANLQAGLVRDHPEWAGQWLGCASVEGKGALTLDCPAEGQPLAASLTPIDEAGAAVGPTTRVPLQGRRATCIAPERARLRLIYAVQRGFDYTNPAACARLIDIVHREYERRAGDFFGDVIVGSFQDELPTMPTWGPTFAESFRQRTGYDLHDHLEWLYDGEDAHAQRVRVDAETVRAALVEEAFFKPLFDWHERHGLICGFDQQHPARQGHPIASVGLYADYLRTHRWYGAPGSDHHGEAKVHSSLAHLYNRPRVWIEAFHSSGWGGTLEETFDWLLPWLRAGANLYDPHAAYYSTRGGWWEWAPPSTCWRQPYWAHYPLFAAAVSRLCYVLSQGHHVCDVGVLFPTTTVQANLTPEGPLPRAQTAHDAYTSLAGLMTWYDVRPGALDRDRRDFDVLDDDSVQRADVADGALVIGAERYRAVVLPACTVLHPATAAKLLHFVENGGRLIAVERLPELVHDADQTLVERLRAHFEAGRATLIQSADDIGKALADLPRAFDAPVPTLHRHIAGRDVLFVPAAFPRATEMAGRHWLTDIAYDFDPQRYRRNMTVRAYGKTTVPQLWDPATGQTTTVPATVGEGYVDVTIPFDGGPAALLVWDDAPATETSAAPRREVAQLAGPWRASLVPTLDNRHGDFALPPCADALPLQTWRVERRRDDEQDWHEALLTFGVYGWFTGPDAPEALPAPLDRPHAGDDPLQVRGWQPAAYSLSRGITHDRLHIASLGPKGRVPQEFLAFGPVRAGHAVRFRTGVWMDTPATVNLVIGAPAGKRVWVNGAPIGDDAPGYHWRAPVALQAGYNIIEFELRAEQSVHMRAFWALVTDWARFERPEWLTLAGRPVKDSRVRFMRTMDVPFEPVQARLHIGTAGACRVSLNGAEIGRQGGFDPYDGSPRVQRYTTSAFKRGANHLVVEIQDQGAPIALLVDAEVIGARGERITIIGDADWTAQRDDEPAQPAALRRRQWVDRAYASEADFASGVDPAWPLVRRRPHPLPAAHWLEDAPPDGSVLSVTPDAYAGAPAVEWFRWTAPGMATAIHLPVRVQATLLVDGVEVAVGEDGWAALPPSDAPTRAVTLRLVCDRGRRGGAAFDGPISYRVAEGPIGLGNWQAYGLEAYSGGLRYRTTFQLAEQPDRLVLDLGHVRGTAEVWLNGRRIGARFCAPWHFELTAAAQAGANALEVLICNTLAPYLRAVSPTHYIFSGQEVSGLFGPVRLLA